VTTPVTEGDDVGRRKVTTPMSYRSSHELLIELPIGRSSRLRDEGAMLEMDDPAREPTPVRNPSI
jgi:hypothetical protein